MLNGEEIAQARLSDWRKLAQGTPCPLPGRRLRHRCTVRYRGRRGGRCAGHHPSVSIGNGYVDLKMVSADAIYRDDDGTEHVVEWVTQQDVDLARRITEIAADHEVDADPASVSVIELGLDTAHSATIAPVWAALLTGNAESQGHGSPSDEIRDATGRVPNLWFGDAGAHETPSSGSTSRSTWRPKWPSGRDLSSMTAVAHRDRRRRLRRLTRHRVRTAVRPSCRDLSSARPWRQSEP